MLRTIIYLPFGQDQKSRSKLTHKFFFAYKLWGARCKRALERKIPKQTSVTLTQQLKSKTSKPITNFYKHLISKLYSLRNDFFPQTKDKMFKTKFIFKSFGKIAHCTSPLTKFQRCIHIIKALKYLFSFLLDRVFRFYSSFLEYHL